MVYSQPSDPPAGPYVFLSYSGTERPRALAIAEALEAAGVRVWLDRRSIPAGASWDAAIVRAIRDGFLTVPRDPCAWTRVQRVDPR